MDDLAKKLAKAKKDAAHKDQAAHDDSKESDKLKKDLEEMTEMAKRAMADMQNLRRRQEEERSSLIKMANANLIGDLLPILDNLDRAKEHAPEGLGDWWQGLEISIKQLHQVFENTGLKAMESLNQTFNPDLHEAMAEGPGTKDTVVEEFEKGYTLGDRVLRHAKVKVGNGS